MLLYYKLWSEIMDQKENFLQPKFKNLYSNSGKRHSNHTFHLPAINITGIPLS